jgi:hypothetical protein
MVNVNKNYSSPIWLREYMAKRIKEKIEHRRDNAELGELKRKE